MDLPDLSSILQECGVAEEHRDVLINAGWTSALIAASASTADNFEAQLPEMLEQGPGLITPMQNACLRLCWTKCSQSAGSASSSVASATAPAAPAVPADSWVETSAPKLTSEVVSQMVLKFRQHYPSEVITPENRPSLRLLSTIAHQKAKKDFRWIPWKYRLTAAKADEVSASRASKVPKIESLGFHHLLDEPPAVEVSNNSMGMHAVRVLFETWAFAMAMREVCHLASLKNIIFVSLNF